MTTKKASRTSRKEPYHSEVDFFKPVDTKAIEATEVANGQQGSCFGKMWDRMDDSCRICADNEVCAIIFAGRLKKREVAMEAVHGTFMDSVDFEGFNGVAALQWLAKEQRSFKEFVEYTAGKVTCPDAETIKMFCKGYIIDHPRLSVQGGKVIVQAL